MVRGRRKVARGLFGAGIILAGLIGAACTTVTDSGTTVTGSGTTVTREVDVPAFSRLEVSHAFVVTVSRGPVGPVTVRIDDNLLDVLNVSVSGGTLRIGLAPGTSASNATLEADVTAPSLEGIEGSGAAAITLVDRVEVGALSVSLSGASRLEGATAIDFGHLEVSGASIVELSGSSTLLEVTASGASTLHLGRLTVEDLTIDLSGASQAEVTVTGSLSAGASGASLLRYGGSPAVTRSESSGASTIEPTG